MCGIAGILDRSGTPVPEAEITRFTETLRHRGPDGSGVRIFGNLALGHRRLSIIDLASGAQPMSNEDESLWVTFNGEIYNFRELRRELEQNHVFRSRSDTEVLLHGYEEWGKALPTRLRGMFSFAIWDCRRQELFLSRDRIGIKPLYYYRSGPIFAFASEMHTFSTLQGFRGTLDLEALDLFLHFQYIPAPLTIFREVRKLPAAHSLVITPVAGREEPEQYWDLCFAPERNWDEGLWRERLDAALDETVRTHLVCDVDFGAFLSGGVDSGTVVGYMSRIMDRPVKTFSIGFSDPVYDESAYARRIAQSFGTEHEELVVNPDGPDLITEVVRHFGEPFGDTSVLPTFHVSRLASRKVKMVLSGDGGDELFAGYSRYQNIFRHHRAPATPVLKMRHAAGNALRRLGLKERLQTPEETWFDWSGYFSELERRSLWRKEYSSVVDSTREWFGREIRKGPVEPLSKFQYFDFKHYLSQDILTKVDVASMYHGLEVRVPLLDHVFLETVGAIPPELKLHSRGTGSEPEYTGKYLLKKIAERLMPPDLVYRKKTGFGLPIQGSFRYALEGELNRRLAESSALRDFFEDTALDSVVSNATGENAVAHGFRVWTLLFLDAWFRNCNAKVFPGT